MVRIAMNFQDLHESVRTELQRRVHSGLVTATSLARQAGFKQAHISNFLNRRRSLSLEGLDRVLAAQNLAVEEFMAVDISAASTMASARELMEVVPVVAPSTAMDDAVVRAGTVIETICVPTARLTGSRARPATRYLNWQRFVALRVDVQQAAAMEPILATDSIAVLDRHYNSLAPYRPQQRTLYAVRSGAGLVLRFVEYEDGRLVLRPLSQRFPVQLIAVGPEETPGDYLVGRVCLLFSEV